MDGLIRYMNRIQSRNFNSNTRTNVASRGSSDASRDAKQRYEHYLALARARALSGDRIEAENYHQHAEHYLRSAAALASAQKADQQRRPKAFRRHAQEAAD